MHKRKPPLPPQAKQLFKSILAMAKHGDEITLGVLCVRTKRTKGSVTASLWALEVAGLIEREEHRPGCKRRITLTRKDDE